MEYKLKHIDYTVTIDLEGKEVKNDKFDEIDVNNNLGIYFLTLDFSVVITHFDSNEETDLRDIANDNLRYSDSSSEQTLLAQEIFEDKNDVNKVITLFKNNNTQNQVLQVYKELNDYIFCTTLTIFPKLSMDTTNILKSELTKKALNISRSIKKIKVS